MPQEQRKFRADPLKLKRLRIAANLSASDIQRETGLSKDTVRKLLQGEPVFLSTLADTVRAVFQIEDANEVLPPEEVAELGIQSDVTTDGRVLEWQIEEYLTGWKETSNGLQYQLARLGHRFLDGRQARGKCYELRHMSTQQQGEIEAHLRRHPDVCASIGDHRNIAKNLTAALVNDLWWVIDAWEPGETLTERLATGPLSEYELNFIMTGIADGLAAMHKVDIIRRELSPSTIILSESSDRPILTDMELAKVLGSSISVSPEEWPDDPYRALEVTGNSPIDVTADIYSWGRIFVHGATGSVPERGGENLAAGGFIPEPVREIALKSVQLLPKGRPQSMAPILKALKGWI